MHVRKIAKKTCPLAGLGTLRDFPDSDKGTSGRLNFEVGSTEDSAPTLETGAYDAHLNQNL